LSNVFISTEQVITSGEILSAWRYAGYFSGKSRENVSRKCHDIEQGKDDG
jgi:hypothetical protein